MCVQDEFSLLVEKWNAQRAKAVAHALLKVLYPLMTKELRVELLKEAKAHILQVSDKRLGQTCCCRWNCGKKLNGFCLKCSTLKQNYPS